MEDANIDVFRSQFLELHPYDQAKLFSKLSKDDRLTVYNFLSPEEMAAVFENVETGEDDYETYLTEMDSRFVADRLGEMYADDAVDVGSWDWNHNWSYLWNTYNDCRLYLAKRIFFLVY